MQVLCFSNIVFIQNWTFSLFLSLIESVLYSIQDTFFGKLKRKLYLLTILDFMNMQKKHNIVTSLQSKYCFSFLFFTIVWKVFKYEWMFVDIFGSKEICTGSITLLWNGWLSFSTFSHASSLFGHSFDTWVSCQILQSKVQISWFRYWNERKKQHSTLKKPLSYNRQKVPLQLLSPYNELLIVISNTVCNKSYLLIDISQWIECTHYNKHSTFNIVSIF